MTEVKNDRVQKTIDNIRHDQTFRKAITFKSFYWFFHTYFYKGNQYPPAEFQKRMIKIASDLKYKIVLVMAFRGSAKSTIHSVALPIWAVLGVWQLKYVLIVASTYERAKEHLSNIKAMLESCGLLIQDYGPFREGSGEWSGEGIILPNGAKIGIASVNQGVRGTNYNQQRPELVVADDVENIDTVASQEQRDNLFNWVERELFPVKDNNTRFIFVGGRIHHDSLMVRLENKITSANMPDGIVQCYPIYKPDGTPMWPGKYPTREAVEKELSVMSELNRLIEYELVVIPDDYQIIKESDIKRFDPEILKREKPEYLFVSIDPASSDNAKSHESGIVVAGVFALPNKKKILRIMEAYGVKLDIRPLVDHIAARVRELSTMYENMPVTAYVEDVSFQKGLVDMLKDRHILAEGEKTEGKSKLERLEIASPYIKCEQVEVKDDSSMNKLLSQILYPREKRPDDIMDACTQAIKIGMKKIIVSDPSEKWKEVYEDQAAKQNGPPKPWKPKCLADWVNMARVQGGV